MSKLFLSVLLLLPMLCTTAQQSRFGSLTYTVPAGYELLKNDNVLTYYKENKATGAYCNFFIYKLMQGHGSVQNDFDYAWSNLVQNPFKISGSAVLQPEAVVKGWKLLAGQATFSENGVNAVATLFNFSAENNMQAVCILSNSAAYKKDIDDFIASADMAQEAGGTATPIQKEKSGKENILQKNSIAGEGFNAITVPPTWNINTNDGKLMLEKSTNLGKRVIEFMSPVNSSGDLERDMAHIFFEVFAGWEPRVPGNSVFQEGDQEKGLTCQGLNYYMLSNSIRKKDPSSFDVIKATVLLIQTGDKVAIINSTDNILGSEVEMALHFLLFNQKIKGAAEKKIDNKGLLTGTWASGGGSYGNSLNSATSYTAAGKYYVLIQSSYTIGYDYYNDLIKKKQFKSEGSFSLSGNVLERKPASGSTSKYFIRFYSRRYGDRPWEDYMSLYDSNFDKEKISAVLHFHKI